MIDMMSKYRVFCTVVELGSFTAAAERLNYSQSAVSQTIKTLEQELGTTLLSVGRSLTVSPLKRKLTPMHPSTTRFFFPSGMMIARNIP